MNRGRSRNKRDELAERCLAAFVHAGTLDLSLDALARSARSSKRMLIHYFGTREGLEEVSMSLLEERLRMRFQAGAFPPDASAKDVIRALWEGVTQPSSRNVLLLTMDLTRRGWRGSEPGRRFFEEQQRLWSEMLQEFMPDAGAVETFLQLFQGAVLVYLGTGNRNRGRQALERFADAMSRDDRKK